MVMAGGERVMASTKMAVGRTLLDLAKESMANDELLARVQERYPQESLRDIVQAAMYVVTDPGPMPAFERERVYDFALSVRRSVGMS